jgi:transcriptional regulator with XRE-family HTH domain
MDFERLASDWLRALRGKRSQLAFSRRLGYRSNVVARWENHYCWPTAAGTLQAAARTGIDVRSRLDVFFQVPRPWLSQVKPSSRAGIVALLNDLRGNVAIVDLAREAGFSRFSVSRWLKGISEPRLPDFLRLVEAASLRVLDFVAAFADPAQLPSVAAIWTERQAAREAAFARPWSHAVLRALELTSYRALPQHQAGFMAARLGITPEEESACLQVLARARQIHKRERKWSVRSGVATDLRAETVRLRELKRFWLDVAQDRLTAGADGTFGFNLFACSEADLVVLREMYLAFFQQMQARIARSEPSECVALYSTQLLRLDAR